MANGADGDHHANVWSPATTAVLGAIALATFAHITDGRD